MKNQERQIKLDEKKWLKGEEIHMDPSGSMEYCFNCQNQKDGFCIISQDERVSSSTCAKAYNKMSRKK